MPVNSVAENVFGTVGTVCWSIQLVPQLWKSYHEKDTTGLSEWMILSWSIAGAFLGTYSIVKNLNIPLILQPQLFSALTMASWAQCQYYGRKRPLSTTLVLFLCGCVILGGFEVGTVYAVRPSFSHGDRSGSEGIEFFGIMSTVLITLSFVPQYYEIYNRKEVIGISIWFMAVDLLGGVFSDLSLVFKAGDFDIVAAVTYSLVIVMDGIVILAAWTLNPRAKRRRLRMENSQLVSESSDDTPERGTNMNQLTGDMTRDTQPVSIVSQSPSVTVAASHRSSCIVEEI
ncbi:PQ loop repeat-domain-containing protein [Lentinula raphanica]|uniref:PQ loop repeat-domain-containing protein n=1 Tax=Lentinula raphanica TaxID=153919 RepID=A0AA38NZ42_9AGAR|nr:PQ loop repeat-domain-containing protein [Lentinula raphanica]